MIPPKSSSTDFYTEYDHRKSWFDGNPMNAIWGRRILMLLKTLSHLSILFLIAGHMYRTNWGICHGTSSFALEYGKGSALAGRDRRRCYSCRWIDRFTFRLTSQVSEVEGSATSTTSAGSTDHRPCIRLWRLNCSTTKIEECLDCQQQIHRECFPHTLVLVNS